MTPKEILKEIVTRLFDGVDIDALSKEEKRIVKVLVREGVVNVVKEYEVSIRSTEHGCDCDFVYPNLGYFNC